MKIVAAFFVLSMLAAMPCPGQTCRTATPGEQVRIQELSDKDKSASITGDWRSLATLWTDDAVVLPPGRQPIIGIEGIRAWLQQDHVDVMKVEVTDYSVAVHETRVCGDEAFQWGTTRMAMKPKGAPSGAHAVGNIERVLRRQADWAWKVERAIWNMGTPIPDKPGESR